MPSRLPLAPDPHRADRGDPQAFGGPKFSAGGIAQGGTVPSQEVVLPRTELSPGLYWPGGILPALHGPDPGGSQVPDGPIPPPGELSLPMINSRDPGNPGEYWNTRWSRGPRGCLPGPGSGRPDGTGLAGHWTFALPSGVRAPGDRTRRCSLARRRYDGGRLRATSPAALLPDVLSSRPAKRASNQLQGAVREP
jgi:hypothetical protein